MESKENFFRKHFISIITFLFLALLFVLSNRYINNKKLNWEKDIRAELTQKLIGKKSALEKALYSRIYYTRGIAAYVSYNPDITTEDYKKIATEFIGNDSVISTMALSKDCIIGAIYPLEGHEKAIGLNLLEHPERKEIVDLTIKTGKTFIAGPVELIEGGIAFISYTPIFNRNIQTKDSFWGVTDIVIYLNKLMNNAGIKPEDDQFYFAIRGKDGKGENGDVFWGKPEVFASKPVIVNIELPYGSWQFATVPKSGWEKYLNQDAFLKSMLFSASLIISLLLWLLLRLVIKIQKNEKQLRAIFKSLDNIIFEFNRKGEYVKVAPTKMEMLILPPKQLIGKNLFEVMENNVASTIYEAIKKCFKEKKLVVTEYPLNLNNRDCWFQARISFKNSNAVILSAYDITEQKKSIDELNSSRKLLSDSNENKDKILSVLAHDLRNPLGTSGNMLQLLIDSDDNEISDSRKKQLKAILNSLKNATSLLENLLEWARKKNISDENIISEVNLREVSESVINNLSQIADEKTLLITNNVDIKLKVNSDPYILRTILRNLISNAIKFSNPGSTITVGSEMSDNINLLFVQDQGIGMTPKQIEDLFKAEKNEARTGTKGEKGAGIGLSLCIDLAQKIGAQLIVESEPDNGTKVKIKL